MSDNFEQLDADIQLLAPRLRDAFGKKTWKASEITLMIAKTISIMYRYCDDLNENEKKNLIERIFKQYIINNIKFESERDKEDFHNLLDSTLPLAIDAAFAAKKEAKKFIEKSCAKCCGK